MESIERGKKRTHLQWFYYLGCYMGREWKRNLVHFGLKEVSPKSYMNNGSYHLLIHIVITTRVSFVSRKQEKEKGYFSLSNIFHFPPHSFLSSMHLSQDFTFLSFFFLFQIEWVTKLLTLIVVYFWLLVRENVMCFQWSREDCILCATFLEKLYLFFFLNMKLRWN